MCWSLKFKLHFEASVPRHHDKPPKYRAQRSGPALLACDYVRLTTTTHQLRNLKVQRDKRLWIREENAVTLHQQKSEAATQMWHCLFSSVGWSGGVLDRWWADLLVTERKITLILSKSPAQMKPLSAAAAAFVHPPPLSEESELIAQLVFCSAFSESNVSVISLPSSRRIEGLRSRLVCSCLQMYQDIFTQVKV